MIIIKVTESRVLRGNLKSQDYHSDHLWSLWYYPIVGATRCSQGGWRGQGRGQLPGGEPGPPARPEHVLLHDNAECVRVSSEVRPEIEDS